MSHTAIVINTAVAILAVVVMIVRFKFNPVVSLVIGSAYLGLAAGVGVEKTIDAIMKGFGDIMAEVGLLIAFGVLMGAILQKTGAIQRLVQTLIRLFGPKRMPYAMSLTIATLLQSIYLDVLLVISAPLGRNLAKKVGKNGTARMAAAMAIGLECGIVLTVPGVGALALAGLLGVPLGKMLLFGVLLVIPTVAIAVAIMSFLFNHGWWNPERDEQEFLGEDPAPLDDIDDEPSSATTTPDDDGPTGGGVAIKTAVVTRTQIPLIVLFAPMLVSLLLIATGAILDAADIHNPIVKFVSAPVIALLIGLVGTSFVGRYALGTEAIQHAIATGFKESGQILILTGVGGSLAATIKAAGLGDILGPASRGVAHRRSAARRGRFRDDLRDHVGGHPRARGADHRARPRADRPGRRCGFPLLRTCHQQYILAVAIAVGTVDARCAEDGHGRRIRRLGRGDPAHPADERPVLTHSKE
jgi:H+/gluconate symporter-like permease